MSLLHVVEACDNYSVRPSLEPLLEFLVTAPDGKDIVIGWIRPPVVPVLKETATAIFIITESFVRFLPQFDSFDKRSNAVAELCRAWKDGGLFSDQIGGRLWRDELYPVYFDPFRRDPSGKDVVFVMERVCTSLFGLITYGVHLTMYLEEEKKFWIPKRASTKQTWPGFLDNTVAGGIPFSMSPTDALIKECMEEASLEESFVRRHVWPAGSISYFYQTSKGWLQPELQYVYDLVVPVGAPSPKLSPLDGEVESFELLDLEEVLQAINSKLFKPNCALVLLDFLIRHGHVTPETDPNYLEVVTRMHSRWWH